MQGVGGGGGVGRIDIADDREDRNRRELLQLPERRRRENRTVRVHREEGAFSEMICRSVAARVVSRRSRIGALIASASPARRISPARAASMTAASPSMGRLSGTPPIEGLTKPDGAGRAPAVHARALLNRCLQLTGRDRPAAGA